MAEAEDGIAGSQFSLGGEGRHGSQGATERTWPKISLATPTTISATTFAFAAPATAATAASNSAPRAFLAQLLHSGSRRREREAGGKNGI